MRVIDIERHVNYAEERAYGEPIPKHYKTTAFYTYSVQIEANGTRVQVADSGEPFESAYEAYAQARIDTDDILTMWDINDLAEGV